MEKKNLEAKKLKEEIARIEKERRVSSWERWKFWIGSVTVPISVAAVTFYAVYKTGYFNAWQKQNENAQYRFIQDTTSFGIKRNGLIRSNDSLSLKNTSLTNYSNNLQIQISHYKELIASGLSKDQKINSLISENTAFHHKSDSILEASNHWRALYLQEVNKLISLNSGNLKISYDSVLRLLWDTQGKLSAEEYTLSKGQQTFSIILENYKDTIRQLRHEYKKQ